MKPDKPEVVSELEFNGMVATLKRVASCVSELNDIRRKKDISEIYECLLSLYYEIYPDMTKDERDKSKELINLIGNHLRNANYHLNKIFLMNKLAELEELLRNSAKVHGFFTKSIKKERVQTLE